MTGSRTGRLAVVSILALASAASVPTGSSSTPSGPHQATAPSAAAKLRGVTGARTIRGKSLTIRRPAGVTRDDVLVAGIGVRLPSARAIKPPAGWRAVRSDTSGRRGTTLTHVVYYKVATGREPTVYRWRFPAARASAGGLLAYSGLDGNRLLAGHSGRVRRNTRLVSAPSVRPGARDTIVIGFFTASGRARLASPGGMTRRIHVVGTPRHGVTAAVADLPVATGATGIRSARSSATHGSVIGQLVALRATTVAPGPQPQPPPLPPPPPQPQPPPPPIGGGGTSLPPALGASTGQTFYVATTGLDSNAGTLAAPWRTVQKAFTTLQPGQRALVRAGTYAESLDMSRAGTAAAPITIENYPGERPVVNGGGQRPLEISSSGAYLRIKGFVFEGSPYNSGGNVDIYGHHLEISANEVRNGQDQGIYAAEESDFVQILGNRIHNNGQGVIHQSHGIYLQGNDHLVANNVIHDHVEGFGIQVYDRNSRSIITANTVTGAGHSGIVVGGSGGVDNIRVVNNVFAFNAHYGISHDSSCPTASRADHNVVFGNAWGQMQAGCSGLDYSAGNRTTDPLFVNYPGRDLHVNAGSPAVDYALPEFSPGGDFDGRARPQAAPDAGAFER